MNVVTLPPGSSPRGRGKLEGSAAEPQPIRLIPAWAGKTRFILEHSRIMAAHPRVGGENLSDHAMLNQHLGSSPRGRGKPRFIVHRAFPVGLIPAWAGKTNQVRASICQPPAHPRVGGENPFSSIT